MDTKQLLGGRDIAILGTPMLDLKTYIPAFDYRDADRIGWYKETAGKVHTTRADERFL